MDHVVRGAAYRARGKSRRRRPRWLVLVAAVSLLLWSGLIALGIQIARIL